MNPPSRLLIGLAAAALLAGNPATGQEKKETAPKPPHPHPGCHIWAGLYAGIPEGAAAGSAGEAKKPADAERHERLLKKLAKAFARSRFSLIGETAQSVQDEYETWVVPSEEFFLKIDCQGPVPGDVEKGVLLHLQLWQKEHVILKTDAILRRKPLFIAGPKWRDGNLILVIESGEPAP